MLVELLLSKGASINAMDDYFFTPLHYAAECGHTGIAELLLERGASIEAINKDGYTYE